MSDSPHSHVWNKDSNVGNPVATENSVQDTRLPGIGRNPEPEPMPGRHQHLKTGGQRSRQEERLPQFTPAIPVWVVLPGLREQRQTWPRESLGSTSWKNSHSFLTL